METVRLSKWLQLKYPLLNQRQREEAIENGLVTYGSGRAPKKGDKIKFNEALNCQKLDSHIQSLMRGNSIEGVKVIKEEEGIVVIDKPAGLASHPISLFDSNTVTQWARWKYPEVNNSYLEPQPTVVPHRLDTGTSGVMIVALTKDKFLSWRERFIQKKITKRYLAWCWGKPIESTYLIESSIAHMRGNSTKMVAVQGDIKYRPPLMEAHSKITVKKKVTSKGLFLAEVECSTGVTHQVRVHLAALGFPLIGDPLYDTELPNRILKRNHHALKAISLEMGGWSVSLPTEPFYEEY